MNIVITGGNGSIGRKLVRLLSQDHEVKVLSRRDITALPAGVRVVKGDIASPTCPLEELLSGCNVIFHCAGELRDETKMESLHVGGTQRLLQAVLAESKRRNETIHWVQLSSVGAYGFPEEFVNGERTVTEETLPRPSGIYEVTKTEADEIVLQAGREHLITYSIVRPSKVFGPEMDNSSLKALAAMIRKGLFFYIGKPGAIATYVHVDDVVDVLHLCGMDNRAKGQIFNISNDCRLDEMVNGIAAGLGVRPPVLRVPQTVVRAVVRFASKFTRVPLTPEQINGLVRRTKYPYLKLEKELGFRPKRAVPELVGKILAAK